MKTLAFFAITAAAGSVQVQSQPIFDISGIEVDGADPTVLSVVRGDHGPLVGIGLDLAYDAGNSGQNASWASELNIVLTHVATGFSFSFDGSDSNFSDTGPADFTFGWGNTSGVFSFSGDLFFDHPFPVDDAFGNWEFLFFDEFDDIGIDGVFLDGSTIELIGPPPASPGVLALLGIGGIALARRRR